MSAPYTPPASDIRPPAAAPDPGMALKRQQHLLIFLTVLIDLIGFGILIPILQSYGKRYGASDWELTMLMGVYSLMQFIFAPILGRLSDRIGRRPVILASLIGSTVGYLILAGADFASHPGVSLALLFFARVVTGICGASFSAAQAYLADITSPEKRAGVMGMIGAAFGLGFMIGPVLGGLATHFGRPAPFFLAAGLSILNFLYAWKKLPESLAQELRGKVSTARASLLRSWSAARGTILAPLIAANFLVITAFSIMTTCFILFTEHRFHLTPANNGLLFGFIGLIGVFIQGGLIRRIAKPHTERPLALAGIVCMTISLILLPLSTPWAGLLGVIALTAIGNSLTSPTLNSMASRAAAATDQGATLGAMASAGSLGRFVGPFLAGPLLYIQPEKYAQWSLWTSALIMASAFLVTQMVPASPRTA
ncbi:MAG: tetA [Verrucomicrobiales bacterium]|nr:tetA [Verrucomicrobiales bacterium]